MSGTALVAVCWAYSAQRWGSLLVALAVFGAGLYWFNA